MLNLKNERGKLMRGESEKRALDSVKKTIENSGALCFGDIDNLVFEKIFLAKPNPNPSHFPDFLFEGGFIEHFQVSTSKKTRKGSELIKNAKEVESKLKKEFEQANSGLFVPKTCGFQVKDCSYRNYCDGFRETWDNHFSKLERVKEQFDTRIFLIEHTDKLLQVYDTEHHQIGEYSLGFDEKLLSFIFEYRTNLEYVIYLNNGLVQIINVEKISDVIEKISNRFVIEPMAGAVFTDTLFGYKE